MEKQFASVFEQHMAYVDTAPGGHESGRTILLLHGNPTSSYLWRNVIPHLEELGRCVAPVRRNDGRVPLFVNADPGSILVGPQREFCRSWPNQTEVTVPGLHFVQEDSADAIGEAVAEFIRTLP